jgi:ABC-2 type transport system ATP-binding protein
VILCSHALTEVEGICDDVVILSSGRVVATGPVADVLERARRDGPQRTALRIRVPKSSVEKVSALLEPLPGVKGVSGGIVEGQLEVELAASSDRPSDDHRATNAVLDALVRADLPVQSFEVEGSRLQDAFLELTERASA